jgi:hypothetical protein
MSTTEIARLPIHFDVPVHYLNADDYVVSVKSFKTAFEEFNKRIFNGAIEYEFLVLPAEDGSFKVICGVLAILTSIIPFLENDLFKGFVKGLTGYNLDFYTSGESAGTFLRDLAVGFFSTECEKLELIIPKNLNLDKALLAKTKFYRMCIANRKISAIGFDDTEKFPIKRTSFALHLSKENTRPLASQCYRRFPHRYACRLQVAFTR